MLSCRAFRLFILTDWIHLLLFDFFDWIVSLNSHRWRASDSTIYGQPFPSRGALIVAEVLSFYRLRKYRRNRQGNLNCADSTRLSRTCLWISLQAHRSPDRNCYHRNSEHREKGSWSDSL